MIRTPEASGRMSAKFPYNRVLIVLDCGNTLAIGKTSSLWAPVKRTGRGLSCLYENQKPWRSIYEAAEAMGIDPAEFKKAKGSAYSTLPKGSGSNPGSRPFLDIYTRLELYTDLFAEMSYYQLPMWVLPDALEAWRMDPEIGKDIEVLRQLAEQMGIICISQKEFRNQLTPFCVSYL